jgi:hypothetical protein
LDTNCKRILREKDINIINDNDTAIEITGGASGKEVKLSLRASKCINKNLNSQTISISYIKSIKDFWVLYSL